MSKADFVGVALNPGKEQKVAPDGPTVFPPLTSEGIEPDIAVLEHVATIGTRAPERQKRGGRAYAGDLEGGARPHSLGVLLTMAFGEPVTTQPDATNAPTVYRHRWNPLAVGAAPVAGTVWTVNVDEDPADPAVWIVDEYMAVGLNEFAMNVEQNDYLLFTAGIAALRNVEGGVPPVAVRDSTELWSFDEVGAEISIPSVSAGAYQDIALYSFGTTYSNAMTGQDQFRLGSKEPVRWRPGNIESTVSFTAAEEIEAHYRRAIADRPELVRMRLTANGQELYGGGADPLTALYESLSVEFKGMEYTTGNVPIDAGETMESIEVEANVVMNNAGELLEFVLINTHDGEFYMAPAAI